MPADQLDARVHQWMQLATPAHPSDQVAALIGVTPAAADPGQPTRLALRKAETRLAASVPAPQPQPAAVAPLQPAEVAPPPPVEQVTPAAFEPAPAPVVAQAEIAPSVAAIPAFTPSLSEPPPARKPARLRRASAPVVQASLRNAVLRRAGNSSAVVQLGAYGNPERVAAAWNAAARRFAAVKGYTPVSARFDGPRGTVYRLSIKGFASDREARLTCESLRRSGGSCFVRNVAGDRPVQLASR